MTAFPCSVRSKSFLSALGTVSLLAAFAVPAMSQSPIAQEPPSQEYQQDKDTLLALAANGNLNSLLSAVNSMEEKWLPIDKQTYCFILLQACEDLDRPDFKFSNALKQHAAAEKYALDALNNGVPMPLGLRANFIEYLTYVPGHGISGVTGEDWSRLRSQRTALWLGTWQQISERTKEDFRIVPVMPSPPPRKYMTQRLIIDDAVDPSAITDAAVRKSYVAALKKYQGDCQRVMEPEILGQISGKLLQFATKVLIAAYSSPPYSTNELTHYLRKFQVDAETRDEILRAVKQNIQHQSMSSK